MFFINSIICVTIYIILSRQLINCSYTNLAENNYWIVALKNSSDVDLTVAIELAKENGFKFYKSVTGFPGIYVFVRNKDGLQPATSKRSDSQTMKNLLTQDDRVHWAAEQIPIQRDKRDYWLPNDTSIEYGYDYEAATSQPFNDELWTHEWYLQDSGSVKPLDLNVLPVYTAGITGRGIRVAVLDDGLEYTHEDLFRNFDPEISWDCYNDRPDPMPDLRDRSNSHGTRCAGEIAMVANNRKCGVGIAYNARIGGIKLLGGKMCDLLEGMALGFAHRKIDVYSSSWGPTDNGKSLERPGPLASYALKRGVEQGRNGRGSIFVWASGNGGMKMDNCNCDGYATSIYTITVGSASQRQTMPWYAEQCTSTLTVTYSSGAYHDQMITTTDVNNECTVKHTGTSASAPLAAGIIALGLEANGNLTWRDVQHIIVNTAEYGPLQNNDGWIKNAAGLHYNTRFGFGLMNADALVRLAKQWSNVGRPYQDTVQTDIEFPIPFGPQTEDSVNYRHKIRLPYTYYGRINAMEHIEVMVHVDYTMRGALSFYLTSPKKTRVQLLGPRRFDNSTDGFKDWKFMSVATWSENPRGDWFLDIIDREIFGKDHHGFIHNCSLIIYGTKLLPVHMRRTNYLQNL